MFKTQQFKVQWNDWAELLNYIHVRCTVTSIKRRQKLCFQGDLILKEWYMSGSRCCDSKNKEAYLSALDLCNSPVLNIEFDELDF